MIKEITGMTCLHIEPILHVSQRRFLRLSAIKNVKRVTNSQQRMHIFLNISRIPRQPTK